MTLIPEEINYKEAYEKEHDYVAYSNKESFMQNLKAMN